MQSALAKEVNLKKVASDLENVQRFIRGSIEESVYAGNPEVIMQLRSLAYAIKNSPKALMDMVWNDVETATEIFVGEKLCPECGHELFMMWRGHEDWGLACDTCGWGR